jgi:hypothetical protein
LLLLKQKGGARDKLIWKWGGGQATSQDEFADPRDTTDYGLCFYANGSLVAESNVPASSSRWSPVGTKGYKYKDTAATEDGMQTILLSGGTEGRAKILAKGKGANLPDPHLPLATPLIVQLVNGDSDLCWESSFEAGDVSCGFRTNVISRFGRA